MRHFPLKICKLVVKGKSVSFPNYAILNGKSVVRLNEHDKHIAKNLKPYHGEGDYSYVTLYDSNHKKKTVRLHRLIAHYFLGPCPDGMEVNHEDGNKQNILKKNLEYVTSSRNQYHAFEIGLKSHKGEKHPTHKLSYIEVKKIRKLYESKKKNQYELSRIFNTGQKISVT